jgi:hypothetical protein
LTDEPVLLLDIAIAPITLVKVELKLQDLAHVKRSSGLIEIYLEFTQKRGRGKACFNIFSHSLVNLRVKLETTWDSGVSRDYRSGLDVVTVSRRG